MLFLFSAVGNPGGINLKEFTGNSVRFSYNEAPEATQYTLQVFNVATNTQQGATETRNNLQPRTHTFTGLVSATEYQIRVTMTGGNYPQQTANFFTSKVPSFFSVSATLTLCVCLFYFI